MFEHFVLHVVPTWLFRLPCLSEKNRVAEPAQAAESAFRGLTDA